AQPLKRPGNASLVSLLAIHGQALLEPGARLRSVLLGARHASQAIERDGEKKTIADALQDLQAFLADRTGSPVIRSQEGLLGEKAQKPGAMLAVPRRARESEPLLAQSACRCQVAPVLGRDNQAQEQQN